MYKRFFWSFVVWMLIVSGSAPAVDKSLPEAANNQVKQNTELNSIRRQVNRQTKVIERQTKMIENLSYRLKKLGSRVAAIEWRLDKKQ